MSEFKYRLLKRGPKGLSTHMFDNHDELQKHLHAMFVYTEGYEIVAINIVPCKEADNETAGNNN